MRQKLYILCTKVYISKNGLNLFWYLGRIRCLFEIITYVGTIKRCFKIYPRRQLDSPFKTIYITAKQIIP